MDHHDEWSMDELSNHSVEGRKPVSISDKLLDYSRISDNHRCKFLESKRNDASYVNRSKLCIDLNKEKASEESVSQKMSKYQHNGIFPSQKHLLTSINKSMSLRYSNGKRPTTYTDASSMPKIVAIWTKGVPKLVNGILRAQSTSRFPDETYKDENLGYFGQPNIAVHEPDADQFGFPESPKEDGKSNLHNVKFGKSHDAKSFLNLKTFPRSSPTSETVIKKSEQKMAHNPPQPKVISRNTGIALRGKLQLPEKTSPLKGETLIQPLFLEKVKSPPPKTLQS